MQTWLSALWGFSHACGPLKPLVGVGLLAPRYDVEGRVMSSPHNLTRWAHGKNVIFQRKSIKIALRNPPIHLTRTLLWGRGRRTNRVQCDMQMSSSAGFFSDDVMIKVGRPSLCSWDRIPPNWLLDSYLSCEKKEQAVKKLIKIVSQCGW